MQVAFSHITVLQQPIVDALSAVPAGWVVDCTLGGGGHTEAILQQLPHLRVLGLDRDERALAAARARLAPFGDRFAAVHAPFSELAQVCAARGLAPTRAAAADQPGAADGLSVAGLSGVIADLGVSSHQVDTPERGFSFRHDGPLDMRMDPSRGQPLQERLAGVSKQELADVLYYFGDIRASRRVADAILDAWQDGVTTTAALADRVKAVMPRGGKTHPATLVFQALRMWVNDELGELEQLLADAPDLLAPGGVCGIISFHSGEDRAVKQVFRERAPRKSGPFVRLARKPILPSQAETRANPRARSAKLRLLRRSTAADLATSKFARRAAQRGLSAGVVGAVGADARGDGGAS